MYYNNMKAGSSDCVSDARGVVASQALKGSLTHSGDEQTGQKEWMEKRGALQTRHSRYPCQHDVRRKVSTRLYGRICRSCQRTSGSLLTPDLSISCGCDGFSRLLIFVVAAYSGGSLRDARGLFATLRAMSAQTSFVNLLAAAPKND